MNKVGWNFPNANGGQTDGFNDPSIDTFIGNRTHSLIRETIQNSLDAKSDENVPAGIDFSLVEIESTQIQELLHLKPYLGFALEQADVLQGRESEASKFYRNAIGLLESSSVIPLLCIHDYNTIGLTGPTEEEDLRPGHWKALVKGSGVSVKSRRDALGSFGHGSKAPFAISRMRTIFYFSKILSDHKHELRFQGKSILQSMKTPNIAKTQGVGYFGKIENCEPLINGEIPDWAISFRNEISRESGTSIYIPFPDLTFNLAEIWTYIELSVLSNFYYAILKGNLRVSFKGKDSLTSENVRERFESSVIAKIDQNTKIQKEFRESLQTAITIHKPSSELYGVEKLAGVGNIEYFMRIGPTVEGRAVGIARQNGMLLTRRAPGLIKNSGTIPFDLFICVTDQEGSEFLRRLENPAHDSFEFDRIISPDERNKFKDRYDDFVSSVRGIIQRHAGLVAEDEAFTDDLDDFLGVTGDATKPEEGNQNSDSIVIERKATSFSLKPNLGFGDGEDSGLVGPGDEEVEAPSPRDFIRPGSIPANVTRRKSNPVKDPRVVMQKSGQATVFFTPTTKENFMLQIHRSGIDQSQPIAFRLGHGKELVTEISFPARRRIRRERIEVYFSKEELKFALDIVNITVEDSLK